MIFTIMEFEDGQQLPACVRKRVCFFTFISLTRSSAPLLHIKIFSLDDCEQKVSYSLNSYFKRFSRFCTRLAFCIYFVNSRSHKLYFIHIDKDILCKILNITLHAIQISNLNGCHDFRL